MYVLPALVYVGNDISNFVDFTEERGYNTRNKHSPIKGS